MDIYSDDSPPPISRRRKYVYRLRRLFKKFRHRDKKRKKSTSDLTSSTEFDVSPAEIPVSLRPTDANDSKAKERTFNRTVCDTAVAQTSGSIVSQRDSGSQIMPSNLPSSCSEIIKSVADSSIAVKSHYCYQRGPKMWDSVVTVVLVCAKNLLPMNDNNIGDLYCKFILGTEKYRSKTKCGTQNPQWLEQFDLHTFFGRSKTLELSLKNHVSSGKVDYMGRAAVDLGNLAHNTTHQLDAELDNCAGTVKLLITVTPLITGTCRSPTYTTNSAKITGNIHSYHPADMFHHMNYVGYLEVKVIKAAGLAGNQRGGKCQPFCELELMNSYRQTQAKYETDCPEWHDIFTFDVRDCHSVLIVTVYNQGKERKFLGKAIIPLLTIKNGCQRWCQLKDKRGLASVNGEILLQMNFAFNHFKAAIRTFQPKERKYMDVKPRFQMSVLKWNTKRVIRIADAVSQWNKFIQSCFNWESTARSTAAFVVFLVVVWNFQLYMLPVSVFLVICANFVSKFILQETDEDVYVDEDNDDYDDDDSDDDEDCKVQRLFSVILYLQLLLWKAQCRVWNRRIPGSGKKGLKEKYKQVQDVILQVQIALDKIASIGERVKNSFNWTVPWLSWLTLILSITAAIVVYYIPLRYIVMAWGIEKFTKKLRSPTAVVNNELLDYLSRVPSDMELKMCRELH